MVGVLGDVVSVLGNMGPGVLSWASVSYICSIQCDIRLHDRSSGQWYGAFLLIFVFLFSDLSNFPKWLDVWGGGMALH